MLDKAKQEHSPTGLYSKGTAVRLSMVLLDSKMYSNVV